MISGARSGHAVAGPGRATRSLLFPAFGFRKRRTPDLESLSEVCFGRPNWLATMPSDGSSVPGVDSLPVVAPAAHIVWSRAGVPRAAPLLGTFGLVRFVPP